MSKYKVGDKFIIEVCSVIKVDDTYALTGVGDWYSEAELDKLPRYYPEKLNLEQGAEYADLNSTCWVVDVVMGDYALATNQYNNETVPFTIDGKCLSDDYVNLREQTGSK